MGAAAENILQREYVNFVETYFCQCTSMGEIKCPFFLNGFIKGFKTLKLNHPFKSSPQQQDRHTGSSVCVFLTTLLSLYQPEMLLYTVMRHLGVNADV